MILKFKQSLKNKPIKLKFFNTKSFPKRSQKEWKLIDKNPFGDTDGDRVPNWFDCKPLNKKKQGKFSQNIPIDEAKKLTFYHGTSKEATEKILKDKFRASEISIHRSLGAGEKIHYGQKRIYVTPNPYIAIDYAKYHSPTLEEGRVLKVTIPIDVIKNQLKRPRATEQSKKDYEWVQNERVKNARTALKDDWVEYAIYEDLPKETVKIVPKTQYKKLQTKAEIRDLKRYGSDEKPFEEKSEALQSLDSDEIAPIEIKDED